MNRIMKLKNTIPVIMLMALSVSAKKTTLWEFRLDTSSVVIELDTSSGTVKGLLQLGFLSRSDKCFHGPEKESHIRDLPFTFYSDSLKIDSLNMISFHSDTFTIRHHLYYANKKDSSTGQFIHYLGVDPRGIYVQLIHSEVLKRFGNTYIELRKTGNPDAHKLYAPVEDSVYKAPFKLSYKYGQECYREKERSFFKYRSVLPYKCNQCTKTVIFKAKKGFQLRENGVPVIMNGEIKTVLHYEVNDTTEIIIEVQPVLSIKSKIWKSIKSIF